MQRFRPFAEKKSNLGAKTGFVESMGEKKMAMGKKPNLLP
jgi:hypothetical protein